MSGGHKRAPLGFARFQRRAVKLIDDQARLRALSAQAFDRIKLRGARLGGVLEDLKTLTRLLSAWTRGEYRQVPQTSIVIIVAAVLYFVVPTDVIPDFILSFGFLDDMAVVGWVVRELRRELTDFQVWEQREDAAVVSADKPVPPVEEER